MRHRQICFRLALGFLLITFSSFTALGCQIKNDRTPTDAITTAKLVVLDLLRGRVSRTLNDFPNLEAALDKEEWRHFREVTPEDILKAQGKNFHNSLLFPLFEENQEAELQLISFERKEGIAVVAYKYLQQDSLPLTIPEIGPMVAVVTLKESVRKDGSQYWLPLTFDYSFTFFDYLEWILINGDRESQRIYSEAEEWENADVVEKRMAESLTQVEMETKMALDWGAKKQKEMIIKLLGKSPMATAYRGINISEE